MRKPARYSDAFLPSSVHPTSVRASARARPWFDHPSGLPSRDFAPLNIGCPPPPPRCPHNDLVAKLRDGERGTRVEPVVPLRRLLLLRPSSVPSGMSYKSPCTLFTRREAAERCRGGRGERERLGRGNARSHLENSVNRHRRRRRRNRLRTRSSMFEFYLRPPSLPT